MSETNKYGQAAKEKIKELAESIDFNMFLTGLGHTPLNAAPMSTKKVDDEGVIWFLSSTEQATVQNIERDPRVQLCYNKPRSMEFLSVFGEATVTQDRDLIKELYGEMDDTWFDGENDPKLRAIGVHPAQAKYWEPKSGMMVSLLKMAYGAVTGNKVEMGQEGTLKP